MREWRRSDVVRGVTLDEFCPATELWLSKLPSWAFVSTVLSQIIFRSDLVDCPRQGKVNRGNKTSDVGCNSYNCLPSTDFNNWLAIIFWPTWVRGWRRRCLLPPPPPSTSRLIEPPPPPPPQPDSTCFPLQISAWRDSRQKRRFAPCIWYSYFILPVAISLDICHNSLHRESLNPDYCRELGNHRLALITAAMKQEIEHRCY